MEPLSDCVLWTGYIKPDGYGQTKVIDGRQWIAHRRAWFEAHGPIPDGMLVLHRCDTPSCVNVDHLWIGTQLDNMRDMVAKGRHHYQVKTSCKNGHAWDEANTRIDGKGHRWCRACARANTARHVERRKASA